MSDGKAPFWRGLFEALVVIILLGAVGYLCYKGCWSKQAKAKSPVVVTCPSCGAKLELKEAEK